MSAGKIETTSLLDQAKTDVAKKDEKAPSVLQLVRSLESQIQKALPKFVDPDRYCRILLTELRRNPDLLKCNLLTLQAAILTSAQIGLELGPLRQCCIVPMWNGKTGQLEAEFQIEYRGLLAIAKRDDYFQSCYAYIVYENDEFDITYGLNPTIAHKPAISGDRGQMIGVYAVLKWKEGEPDFCYLTAEQVIKRKKASKSAYDKNGKPNKYSPWSNWEEEMWMKTAVRFMLSRSPLSNDTQEKIMNDMVVKAAPRENMLEMDQDDVITVDLKSAEK